MRGLVIAITLLVARVAFAHVPVTQPCAACHEDKHHGEFAADCASCHVVAAWAPSTFGVAQHAQTKYALTNAHAATPCSGCHPGARPRLSFIVAGSACIDCHENTHGQKFANASQCEACHATATWKAWKIDHRTWPLTGAHDRIACATCHPGATGDTPPEKLRGVARACEKCHDDAHAGQFAQTRPVRDCASCHTTETFRGTTYKHREAHEVLPCATCHPATTLRNGETATRWRLPYRACKDCHANPHPKITGDCKACHAATGWKVRDDAKLDHDRTGFQLRGAHTKATCTQCHTKKAVRSCEGCHTDPHAGRQDGACAECHTATAWSDTKTLDRHRLTRMPLTGAHAVIDCSACHKRQGERTLADLPVDCFGCHWKRYRALPSHATNQLEYPRECTKCHTTIAWLPARDPDADVTRATHDARFLISSGGHRDTACNGCHVTKAQVRCDGCHATHPTPVARATSSCLHCHPRGARR